ncbi:MAG: MaoC family dehydratase N-terminal domain-containing protein [Comamonadaceae bacterium]|nr:MaoC family dehydratase N-terminal domain-containing protein [Comamonadaceae bacterium]
MTADQDVSNAAAAPALDAALLAHLQSWQGRTETCADTITLAPLRGLAATLDHAGPMPENGKPVPPLGHWLYFLPHHRQSELGSDGHARRGGFLPPVPLPRRMWAGGRLQWAPENPLRAGDQAQRRSRIVSVTHKRGRTGDLVFVLVRHEVHNARGLCLTEEHDIVYRAAAQPGEPAPEPVSAEQGALWRRDIQPNDVMLFRYSALTFNGHRIHYDRRYATEIEGYPGLVVHGPLIATLLTDLACCQLPGAFMRRFAFKAVRPTFDLHPFAIHGQPQADGRCLRLWASDHEGALTMQASAELA